MLCRLAPIMTIVLTGAALAACSSVSGDQVAVSTAKALARPSDPALANRHEVEALTADGWRRKYAARQLFARAASEHDSVQSLFNLATSYHQTGRFREAAAIYAVLLEKGQFTVLRTTPDVYAPTDRGRGFTVAAEAARRLQMINASLTQGGAEVATAAIAGAGEAAPLPASLFATGMADDEALRLDEMEAQDRPEPAH